jgi:DNA mismatch repair protein MutL
MAAIRLLEESIAQKIAAGEVVERPASVVKELVENSIDAGSTFITVEIKEGGVARIRVTDNGCGIPSGEVELAFLRHATSKIQDLQDLYAIRQMGFRGEALYSIAAVSKLEMTTKPAAQSAGVRLVMHGGKKASFEEFGCPDGTTIIADNLFYNTPARLKFLNKPGIEAGYVGSAVTRQILANPGVSIKFIADDKVLYHSSGDGSLKNAIYTVFGKEVAQGLLPVELEENSLSVTGYLFAPAEARGNRGGQMLIVNGRPVMHSAISAIVERAFAGLADSKRFPGFVLRLTLPPEAVDVNVHPNKLQVRFADEHAVKQAIEVAVSKAMEQYKGAPLVWSFPKSETSETGGEEGKSGEAGERQSEFPPMGRPGETVSETVDRLKQSVRQALGAAYSGAGFQPVETTLMQRPSIPNIAARMAPPEQIAMEEKKPVRVIGQVFETYALLEFEDKLLIVDQHAAHERLLYEKFSETLKNAEACSQKLLIPQVITVSHETKAVLDGNLALLQSLGFELEEYGRLSYRVNAVPFILGQPQVQDIIFDLVEILSDERSVRTEEIKREKLMSMACKKAVKGGDRLSATELSALVGIIAAEDIPLTCPHGRPFVIILDRHSMEKQFRRTK